MKSIYRGHLFIVAALLPIGLFPATALSEDRTAARAEDPRSGDRVLLEKLGTGDLGPFAGRWAATGREEIRAERVREKALRKAGRAVQAEATRWTPLGPAGMKLYGPPMPSALVSGLVADIRVHPTDPKTIWVATAGGGVWKTTDGAATWKPTMDDLGRMQVGAVAVSKSKPTRVYAGSGCGDNSNYVQNFPGLGLLVSDDGGETWRTTASGNTKTGPAFWELDVDPANHDVVLAAATNGLLRSEDGGDTWVVKIPARTMSLSRCQASPDVLFAAAWDGQGPSVLWKSTNGGKDWVVAGETGLPGPAELRGRAEIVVAPSDPLRVYVHYAEMGKADTADSTLDVAVSDDGGAKWTASNLRSQKVNIGGSQGNSFSVMAVDPSDRNVVWAGGLDLWKSTDGGKSFRQVADQNDPGTEGRPDLPYVHSDQHAYVFGPGGTPYFGTDGGIFTTADGGKSFVSLNVGLAITQPNAICLSTTDPLLMLGGAQDNSTPMRKPSGEWIDAPGGDGMGCLVHPSDPKVLHISSQNEYVSRSLDGGATWQDTIKGLSDAGNSSRAWFSTVLRRHPVRSSVLYTFSKYKLWVTEDNASLWKTNTANPPGEGGAFVDLHVLPTDGSRLLLATSAIEVVETADEGKSWKVLGKMPVREIATAIRYDRRDVKTLWLSVGTTSEGAERVWRSTDAAVTWTAVSRTGQAGGLPDVPVFSLEQDPDDAKVWWAGTFVGLYRTGDDGKTWGRHGFGLPNTIVMAIDFFRPDKKVRVASFGRSFWEAPTAAPPPGPTAEITFPSESTTVEEGIALAFVGKGTSSDPNAKLVLRWSWGDQTQEGTGESPTHTYWWRGTYTVVLTVTDAWGSKATATRVITVIPGQGGGGGRAKLQGGKVEVGVTYRDPVREQEAAATPQPQADTFAFFYFSDPGNPEVFVKVLDFGADKPYLLFWGGLTSYEYVVRFTVPATGKTAAFVVAESSYKGGADTTSLPHSLGGGAAFLSRDGETVTPLRGGISRFDEVREVSRLLGTARRGGDELAAPAPVGPDAGELVLSSGQVGVSVSWSDPPSGRSGQATPIPKGDAFGYFYFSEATNPEVFVKVLDFGADKPFLLFWAGLTNFQYTVTYRNVKTGKTAVFNKPAGSYDGGADTTSLPH